MSETLFLLHCPHLYLDSLGFHGHHCINYIPTGNIHHLTEGSPVPGHFVLETQVQMQEALVLTENSAGLQQTTNNSLGNQRMKIQ